ncbi:MAG TPA: Rne/Rng family ribonuclease [Gaiellaceae bacterium]|nr:Rne/Rng family ribonuclease [Gaiellaceae bacterium]
MPLRWFRRRKDEQAPTEAAAPESTEAAAAAEPAAPEGGTETTATRKRRRGSRGGRGRGGAKKTTAVAATNEVPPAAEKPERRPAERRQRQQTRRRAPQRRAPLPPAKRALLISVDVSEQRAAVLEDGKVAEVYLERPERRSIAGNIYLGLVDNVLPGMEAAFIEIGLEKNGFLYVDEIVRDELEGTREGSKKIQDMLSRGQSVLVQAVKDPMKTKGARLTMEVSLPGRFVVFVPHGEGLGVSRRLPDEERARLKDIVKGLAVKRGGVIVRTAAEGASADDIERDLVFLQKLWKTIEQQAKRAKAPALVYQEAELPLRIVRDLFTGDFERAVIDHERTYRRVVGYLKKTSPHMVERVHHYKEKTGVLEKFGVDAEIRSTLSRRVDLPSGGYLVFDYAEAFTVIDVNTGRFVGSRAKTSTARLEDTITKNNLEAVKEVVRQLRLRDIGGIIVIDFIDMANPKNRETVEEALRQELERDRTKTYVVEISPLGLVEMTRQNVTDGPREVMTRKCPTCGGDGIVYSEASAAIDVERRLRALAAGARSQAFRVELAAPIAAALIGPGAARLLELESLTKRRVFLEGKPDTHLDHFVVLAEGKLADLAPEAPVEEGAEVTLELGEVDRHASSAAVGRIDGLAVVVGDASSLVGKRVKVRIERVLDGTAYATLLRRTKKPPEPLTAEAEAEKPTRKPPARRGAAPPEPPAEPVSSEEEPETPEPPVEGEAESPAQPAPKKTRRGTRGGRKRRKPVEVTAQGEEITAPEAEEADADEPAAASKRVTIHIPADELGRVDAGEEEPEPVEETPSVNGAAAAKRRTRRGSRGGKNRRKRAAAGDGGESAAEKAPVAVEEPAESGDPEDWGYVPMSEWGDEFEE